MVLRRAAESVRQVKEMVDTTLLTAASEGYRPYPIEERQPPPPQEPAEALPMELRQRRWVADVPETETARSASVRRDGIVAALQSTEGVRRAFLYQEILGPPRSMHSWDER